MAAHPCEPGADEDVVGLKSGLLAVQVEIEPDLRTEDQAIGRAAEMEHPELIAFFHLLPCLDGDVSRGNLTHPDGHEAEGSDGWMVRFDEDDGRSRHLGDVALRFVGSGGVKAHCRCL
jgi:hypothetical protein